MALSASTLGSLIDSNLSGFGANGYNRTVFSNAIATGVVMSIVGKTFVTADIGLTAGTGAGIGVGVVGLNSSNMASMAIAAMSSTGVNAQNLMDAIMSAVQSHLASSATLTSVHTPVYAGAGTIVVGSIPVSISEMAGNINTQLSDAGAVGVNRFAISTAIATGIVNEILSAGTGTVVITGSPPGSPAPGAGAGAGVIS